MRKITTLSLSHLYRLAELTLWVFEGKRWRKRMKFWAGDTEAKVSTGASGRAINHTSANGSFRWAISSHETSALLVRRGFTTTSVLSQATLSGCVSPLYSLGIVYWALTLHLGYFRAYLKSWLWQIIKKGLLSPQNIGYVIVTFLCKCSFFQQKFL